MWIKTPYGKSINSDNVEQFYVLPRSVRNIAVVSVMAKLFRTNGPGPTIIPVIDCNCSDFAELYLEDIISALDQDKKVLILGGSGGDKSGQ